MSKLKKLITLLIAVFAVFSMALASDDYERATTLNHKAIADEYFGIHFHRLTLPKDSTRPKTVWPTLQVGSVRLWDSYVRWADIAPAGGQWSFDHLDSLIEQAQGQNVPVLYVFGSTPRWASARPNEQCPYGNGCSAAPIRLAHWEEYVRRVVTRYKGRIATYELWNEPFFSDLKKVKGTSDFYYGSVGTMIEMARIAHAVIAEVDPLAQLFTPGFTGNPNQLELFLKMGGKKYIDGVAFHFYSGDSLHFVQQLNEVREVMARQDVSNLPIWNTETGVEIDQASNGGTGVGSLSPRETAAALMGQYLIIGGATGLQRYYYYAWDNERSGMYNDSQPIEPTLSSYLKLRSWLIGYTFIGCNSKGTLVICLAKKGQEQSLFVWATKPTESAIALPVGTRAKTVERLFGDTPSISSSIASGNVKMAFDAVPTRIQLEIIMRPVTKNNN